MTFVTNGLKIFGLLFLFLVCLTLGVSLFSSKDEKVVIRDCPDPAPLVPDQSSIADPDFLKDKVSLYHMTPDQFDEMKGWFAEKVKTGTNEQIAIAGKTFHLLGKERSRKAKAFIPVLKEMKKSGDPGYSTKWLEASMELRAGQRYLEMLNLVIAEMRSRGLNVDGLKA